MTPLTRGQFDSTTIWVGIGEWKVIEYGVAVHDVTIAYRESILLELPYGEHRDNPTWSLNTRYLSGWKGQEPPGTEDLLAFVEVMVNMQPPVQLMIDALAAKIQVLTATQPGE